MFEQHSDGLLELHLSPSGLQGTGVGNRVGVGVGVASGACATTRMVALAEVDAGGVPLSVQVKLTAKLCPTSPWFVVCRYRPVDGFPLV